MNRTVYLAGAMYGLSYDEASLWRNQVKKDLGHAWEDCLSHYWEVLDPMQGKEDLGLETFIGMEYDDPDLNHRAIVEKDLFHVREASVILANLTNIPACSPSIGTMMELGYALALNKLVYVVADKDSLHAKHPFIKGRCVVFPTISRAVASIMSL